MNLGSQVIPRRRIGFLTSAFIPRQHAASSFEFFAILTAEVVGLLQDDYDMIVRVPRPNAHTTTATEQRKLLAEFLNSPNESFEALVISPADAKEIVTEIAAFSGDITFPILTIDQTLDLSALAPPKTCQAWSIIPDNEAGGRLAAEALLKYYGTIPTKENIRSPIFLIVEGTGSSPERAKGFEDELRKRLPGITPRKSEEPLEYRRDTAASWMSRYLRRQSENELKRLVGVFACSDEMALGVCDALDEYVSAHVENLQETPDLNVAVVGFDGIDDVARRLGDARERWLVNTVASPISGIAERLQKTVKEIFSDSTVAPTDKKEDCSLKATQQVEWHEMMERRRRWKRSIVKPRPDILVITVKPEERDAVRRELKRLKPRSPRKFDGLNRQYEVAEIQLRTGRNLTLALVQQLGQGLGHAQDTARDAIEDLNPRVIALVGICGAVPSEDVCLGDVIGSTEFIDFSVGAHLYGFGLELAAKGASMNKRIQEMLQSVTNDEIDWTVLKRRQPGVDLGKGHFYGTKKYCIKTKSILKKRFISNKRASPIFRAGKTVSDGMLAKDSKITSGWRTVARDMLGIEMELPGIYLATHRRDRPGYPIVAIRGISDIVGFKRSDEWTAYACNAAAVAFFSLLRNSEHFTALLRD